MSKASRDRMKCFGYEDRSLLDVALDVHMTTTGAMDRFDQDQEDDVATLLLAIETWEPSIPESSKAFDDAVLAVLKAAVSEAARESTGAFWGPF